MEEFALLHSFVVHGIFSSPYFYHIGFRGGFPRISGGTRRSQDRFSFFAGVSASTWGSEGLSRKPRGIPGSLRGLERDFRESEDHFRRSQWVSRYLRSVAGGFRPYQEILVVLKRVSGAF